MSIAVEIIFVGLYTLLNVADRKTGTGTEPVPSVLVHRMAGHDSFIAYDTREVSMSGGTGQAIGGSYEMILLDEKAGESLRLKDLPVGRPSVDVPSVRRVASFAAYSRIPAANLAWDEEYVPKGNGKPKAERVAAHLILGGGHVSAGRITRLKWDFVAQGETPNPARAAAYMRDVHYRYSPATSTVEIDAVSLDNGVTTRTIRFTPHPGVATVKLWIGTSTGPYKEITGAEPSVYQPGTHFSEYYKLEKRPDSEATDPSPVPVPVYYDGRPAPRELVVTSPGAALHSSRRADPEIGYCGGSQGGCNPCP